MRFVEKTLGIADLMHSLNMASSSEWLGLSSERSLSCSSVAWHNGLPRIELLLPLSTGDDKGVPHMLNLCVKTSVFCAKGMQLVGGGVICRTYI